MSKHEEDNSTIEKNEHEEKNGKSDDEKDSHDVGKQSPEHGSNTMKHKVNKHVHKAVTNKKSNPWKIVSGVLLILWLIALFTGGGEKGSISKDEASKNAIDYINNNLLQPGTTATLKSVEEVNNLYNIKMDVGGTEFDSYMTKDGKLLFPNVVELEEADQPSEAAEPAEPRPTAPAAPSVDMTSMIDDDAVKGDEDAPVTIVEWSDFECPFCARFYSQTYGQIVDEYINTGKVKLVFRDFPLGFHANAQKAAEAAECAGEQGKYYEMHDKLFEDGVTGGVASFKQYAKQLGLDTAKFDQCLDSGAMAAEVAKDMQDGQAAGITGTPGFIINGKLLSGAQPFSAFKQAIDTALSGDVAPSQPTKPSAPSFPTDMKSLVDDDTIKGKADAPVTIVEWSDFECPFCTRFFTQTLGDIDEKYIKTGKVKFVYRDFPLGFHANAQKSAEAAECAGEQGKFWEMHDKLFENGVTGGVASFKQYAKDIGLDTSEFDECLDSGKMAPEVAKDMRDGQAAGITGTPGFIINGKKLSGAQPFSAFEQIIEAELTG